MFQKFIRLIYAIALRVFFKEYRIINNIDIPKEGPLIIVGNHPSTFMDPIIISNLVQQEVYFIAAGSFFKSAFTNWFMRNVTNSIPVHRKKDDPSKMGNNESSFEQCFEFLEGKGTLILFPEGTSINERKLRDIKTGAARIALGTETRNDFNLGVKILCVGINYSDAPSFRSDVWVNVQELIDVKEFKEAYQLDDRAAVKSLTTEIQKRLERNIIITEDKDEDQFIRDVEMMYKNELISELNLDPKIHSFALTKGIQEAVHRLNDLDKDWLEDVKTKVSNYIQKLRTHQLEDSFLMSLHKDENQLISNSIKKLILLLIGSPIYIYGIITNYIPYFLPKRIAKLFPLSIEYEGPIKMTSGVFTFSIFYSLLIYLFQTHLAGENYWWTILFGISLPVAGFFALSYARNYLNLKKHIQFIRTQYKNPKIISELVLERKQLIREFDWAKEQHLE